MPEHSVRFYKKLQELGVPVRFYCHQAGHGGPPPFEHMNRWFSRYLCGIENGIEDEPLSWIVREGDRPGNPTPYPDYPHPEAAPVTLYPAEGGSKTGDLGPEQLGGQGVETLVDDVKVSGAEMAAEKSSKQRLLYATPELTEALHLSGTGTVTVRLASNKPGVNLSVWIVSLPWTKTRDINSNIITRGWADPQNHAALTHSEPLVPGEFYELRFELQPDDQVIPAGKRIGLMIFSSDRDFTLWPAAGTELTIDLDATSLELPVVGGKAAFEKAVGA
jgi:X-Pro dipeptidyl-peptidase